MCLDSTPITIDPGESKDIKFMFSPLTEGYKSAEFKITTNDPNAPEVTIKLVGRGINSLDYIKIIPEYWNAKVGETKKFTVKAYYVSGSKDVSDQVSWRSEDPDIVEYVGHGIFKALKSGSTYIVAEYNGKTDRIRVTVDKNVHILKIKTNGLESGFAKVWIDGKCYEKKVNDYNPISISLEEGVYKIEIQDNVDCGNVRYHCENCLEENVRLDSDKTLTFNFEPQYKVDIKIEPKDAGRVILNPQKTWYSNNEYVYATAIPNDGYEFDYWGRFPVIGSPKITENPLRIQINNPITIIAHFKKITEEKEQNNESKSDNNSNEENKQKKERIKGDLNDNGKLDPGDAVIILRATVKKIKIDSELADMNGNGKIDVGDAIIVLKKVVSST
jgi:hypothetical protein